MAATAADLLQAGVKKLHSNQAINGAFDYLVQGGADLHKFGKQVMGGTKIQNAAEAVYKQGGSWNASQIAGSYIVGSSAARVVSGGGITKDRNGNNDLIGIPFI